MSTYLDAVTAGSVVILDGATGTSLQGFGLTPDDFGGPSFEGCNELLSVTRPDVIEAVHRSFFEVGVDVTETNTFGAFPVPLGEYGIADRTYELAAAATGIDLVHRNLGDVGKAVEGFHAERSVSLFDRGRFDEFDFAELLSSLGQLILVQHILLHHPSIFAIRTASLAIHYLKLRLTSL